MRVVVTGATGLVGQRLTRRLLDLGHEVVAWSRDAEAAQRALPAGARAQTWNPGAAVSRAALAGVDAIVHLAGESIASGRWTAKRKVAIRESRVATTTHLVEALAALPATERPSALVSASAIGIYGDRGDEVLDEASACGSDFLARICEDWESAALRASALGVRTAVLRIGVVLAAEGGALAKMLPPFRLGLGGRLGSGEQWMSWIHVDDLVEMLRCAVERPEWRGVVNAVTPEPLTNRAFTSALSQVLHRPAIAPVPGFALRLLLGEMASILLGGQRVSPTRAEALGFRWMHRSAPQALAALLGAGSPAPRA